MILLLFKNVLVLKSKHVPMIILSSLIGGVLFFGLKKELMILKRKSLYEII